MHTFISPLWSSCGCVFDFPVRPSKPKSDPRDASTHQQPISCPMPLNPPVTTWRLPLPRCWALVMLVDSCLTSVRSCNSGRYQQPMSRLQPKASATMPVVSLLVSKHTLALAPALKPNPTEPGMSRPPHCTLPHSRATLRNMDHDM